METILELALTSLEKTGLTLLHNWPYLLVGIFITAVLKLYIDAEKISAFLKRFRGLGVIAATGISVATPLCSCGTTAVILGMMASSMPWAPIVAFMVASPLSSPEGLFVSAGLFGWPFALAAFLSSIFLGLTGGAVAVLAENLGWLKNQARFADSTPTTLPSTSSCGCQDQTLPEKPAIPIPVCGCSTLVPVAAGESTLISFSSIQPVMEGSACKLPVARPIPTLAAAGFVSSEDMGVKPRVRLSLLATEMLKSGKQLLPMFLGFAFIGYFLNGLIPTSWVSALFGSGNIYSVPLAATLGLPLYINGEASLPLVRSMLDGGMSQGAALAFIISGAGTSIGAIAGALTIARWRVVALVVTVLWAGAILTGFAFNFLQSVKLF